MANLGGVGWLIVAAVIPFAACGGSGPLSAPMPGAAGQQATGGAGSGSGGAVGTAGSGGTIGTAGTGTGVAGTTGAAGTGTGAAGTTGAAGASGFRVCGAGTTPPSAQAGVAICTTYCTAIMANCTGAYQQYSDMADCMKACSYMPAGSANHIGDNSASCRTAYAMVAATDKDVCPYAGPLSEGPCGNDCDLFCTIATSYCSAAGGYAGTPPYASCADCLSMCGQFQRVLGSGMPGSYSATYTPGPTAAETDTLECRAYHLFINALPGGAFQTTHCPHAANKSAPCGPGIAPPDLDGGTTPDGPIPRYDGSQLNIINSANWDETRYPPAQRRMLLRDQGDPHIVMIDLGKTPALQWKQVAGGPWARAMQLIGHNQILGGRSDGYEVFDYTTGAIVKTVNTFGNTQSAYRMATGETMLTTSGTVLRFLDRNDVVSHQISYPGFGFVRLARPTRNGTFLVPSDQTLFEGDATGNVLWKATGAEWGHIHEALLMGDGNTLVATFYGASCDVVNRTTHLVTKRYGTRTMPNAAMFHPNVFAEFEILPNGNIITSNWQGQGAGYGGSGIQVIEFNPAGEVVWFYQQDPNIFSSIQGVMVLDGKDPQYLHVQEISTDSTWQPVIPTP